MLWESFKVTAPSRTAVAYLETNCQRTLLCQLPLFTTYSCWQRRNEKIWKFDAISILSPECCYALYATMLWMLRNIGNGAVNTPRCWQLPEDAWQSKKFYWSSIFLSTFAASLIVFLACNTEKRNVSIVLSTKVVQTLFRCWQWCYEFYPSVGNFFCFQKANQKKEAL